MNESEHNPYEPQAATSKGMDIWPPATKIYLGDSVYAQILEQCGTVMLTTENGGPASNTIVLEPQVFRMLIEYMENQGFKIKHAKGEG